MRKHPIAGILWESEEKNWNFDPKKTPKIAYIATIVTCGSTRFFKKKSFKAIKNAQR